MKLHDKVNFEIADHATGLSEWEHVERASELYWFASLFNAAFFPADRQAPMPAISFEKGRVGTLGTFRIGHNDMGIKNHINLNKVYLDREMWQQLSTLFHEMVHAWEYEHLNEKERTKSWYHAAKFREMMASVGIETDKRGCHIGLDMSGRFVHVLRQHGIEFKLNSSNGKASGATTGGMVTIAPPKKRGRKK